MAFKIDDEACHNPKLELKEHQKQGNAFVVCGSIQSVALNLEQYYGRFQDAQMEGALK